MFKSSDIRIDSCLKTSPQTGLQRASKHIPYYLTFLRSFFHSSFSLITYQAVACCTHVGLMTIARPTAWSLTWEILSELMIVTQKWHVFAFHDEDAARGYTYGASSIV